MKMHLNLYLALQPPPFLDKMCTHSVDFQECELRAFEGTKGSCWT